MKTLNSIWSDTDKDLECSPLVTPNSTAGMLLAIESIRTYLSCPLTTCNMKKLQTVGEKLTCPSCKRTFPAMAGSLQVIAKLLVDVGGDVQALTFFAPALKANFTMMDLEFSITRDTACINAQLMKWLSTNFSFVAKDCYVSKIVAVKRPSPSD